MENELKAILHSRQFPHDLVIIYDDRHPLWGGSTITLLGSGRLERQTAPPGGALPSSTRLIDQERILELVELLVELSAWEQHTAEATLVPDESRPELVIRLGGKTSRVWERHHEMRKNQRLVRVKERLESLAGEEEPGREG
jgi:hypothetical protein